MQLLNDDRSRRIFLEELNQARSLWKFHVLAYVLMPEHVHLLIWPTEATYSIPNILKAIKQPFSQRIVAEWRRDDPDRLESVRAGTKRGKTLYALWQPGGGYDRNMFSPQGLWNSIEYIHMNPVRRGLVQCSTDWVWSSANAYEGTGLVKFNVDFCEAPRK